MIFQSTLPREERLCRQKRKRLLCYFNPRSHERSDGRDSEYVYTVEDFNPRSHERSDIYLQFLHYLSSISIHAPTRGATVVPPYILFISSHFNPRSHERSDGGGCVRYVYYFYYFNPRSHERSDFCTGNGSQNHFNFNPRSHERSDSNIAQKICLFLYNTDNKYIIR